MLQALEDPDTLRAGLQTYPPTRGGAALRAAAADWLRRRFGARVDSETQVLPVNGTREALFSFGQAMLSGASSALVLLPNPCYQTYEGAALLRGATPHYVPCRGADQLPDLDAVEDAAWRAAELVYVCSPGNPTGAVLPEDALGRLIERAHRFDFVIAADECYSEIYADEDAPPPGLLQAAAAMGDADFRRCVVFHSLSKRSNLPGLRSGFVAGDAAVLERYYLYRTYHGCAMPTHVQAASVLAWGDETHVRANRAAYREKFDATLPVLEDVLPVARPEAAFYLWPRVPGGGGRGAGEGGRRRKRRGLRAGALRATERHGHARHVPRARPGRSEPRRGAGAHGPRRRDRRVRRGGGAHPGFRGGALTYASSSASGASSSASSGSGARSSSEASSRSATYFAISNCPA